MVRKRIVAIAFVGLFILSSLFVGAVTKPVSVAPDANNIVIVNNAVDLKDKITVSGLATGDYFTVYKSSSGTDRWGISTKVASGATSVSLDIAQLGTPSGAVYVSVTSLNSTESSRTPQNFNAEQSSTTPLTQDLTIVNNVDKPSTVTLTGLNSGDKIYAYSDVSLAKTSQLGTEAKVATGATSATINVPDKKLNRLGGTLYVTLKQPGYLISSPLTATYIAAQQVSAPTGVQVVNNVDSNKKSTISANGLTAGDKLIAYKDTTYSEKVVWGIAVVPSNSTTASVSIINDPNKPSSGLGAAGGTVYVAVRRRYYRDSDPIPVNFVQKPKNVIPNASDIQVDVFNSYDNVKDVITVTNLSPGDVIKVWSDPTSTNASALIVKGTVLTGMTSISLATPTATSLSSSGGSVYVSVKSINSLESDRQKVTYAAEP